ncbi:MAG TPA: PP2C family protein-serine/threonine phosphatase [Bacteroidota bacterium]|nr:PP2C family protein-serine/threonine phosphatase [Bacteroidota bacterium]
MEHNIIRLIKENILQRRQNVAEFLETADAPTIRMRVGPAGESAAADCVKELDTCLHKAEDHTLGICDICQGEVDESRLRMDYTSSVCLEHLSSEERARLESDLELSQKVQRALLPQSLPEIPGLELAAFSQPAHIVGGDYFDFLKFKDDSHAIAIADVMGKGVPASMLMANLQASLRIIVPESDEPASIICRLNRLFGRNINLTKFVTFVLAQYHEHTRSLTYCNAGHNPPLVRRQNGTIERLMPTGAAIGLISQTEFSQNTVTLQPGDRVLLYTDGVVESFNQRKEFFGEERLEKFLQDSVTLPTARVIAALQEAMFRFTQSNIPADDTTIIVLTAK